MSLTVVKIGGNVVDNPEALDRFLDKFAALPGPKILVHGGGKEATRLSDRLGVLTEMVNGRRVTSAETIDIVTMVYAGLVNKRIVSRLQARGCNAIGLSGADGNAVTATKRPPVDVDGRMVDFGYVGDIAATGVNHGFISALIGSGAVPVFCAIMHDGHGQLLNCNADAVAAGVAIGMSRVMPTDLVYCFEQPGVMLDIDDPDSVIPTITPEYFAQLKADGVVSKGMLPKLESSFKAIAAGVNSVVIKHADNLDNPTGTVLK